MIGIHVKEHIFHITTANISCCKRGKHIIEKLDAMKDLLIRSESSNTIRALGK